MKRVIPAFVLACLIVLFAMAGSQALAGDSVTAAITAQNTFSSPVGIRNHGTIRISGTFVATVSLQRSEDGTTWYDTGDTWTAGGVFPFTDYTRRLYRAGVKTGNFTSGTVNIEIGSGE